MKRMIVLPDVRIESWIRLCEKETFRKKDAVLLMHKQRKDCGVRQSKTRSRTGRACRSRGSEAVPVGVGGDESRCVQPVGSKRENRSVCSQKASSGKDFRCYHVEDCVG